MSDLDPARVNAARLTWQQHTTGEPQHIAQPILAADDERAREAGLVCTGDGLTVALLRQALYGDRYDQSRAYNALPPALRGRLEGGEQRG